MYVRTLVQKGKHYSVQTLYRRDNITQCIDRLLHACATGTDSGIARRDLTSAVLEALIPIFFSGGPLEGHGAIVQQNRGVQYMKLHKHSMINSNCYVHTYLP